MDEMYDSFRSLHSMQGDLHQRRLLYVIVIPLAKRLTELQHTYCKISILALLHRVSHRIRKLMTEKDDQMHILQYAYSTEIFF